MEIFVDAGNSGRFGVITFPALTIWGLKQRVEEVVFVPASQQHIVFGGQQLDNDRTLYSYQINKGCTVRCNWNSWKRDLGYENVKRTPSQQWGTPQNPPVKSGNPKNSSHKMPSIPSRKSSALSAISWRKPVPSWQSSDRTPVPRISTPFPAEHSFVDHKTLADLPTSAPIPIPKRQSHNIHNSLEDLSISTSYPARHSRGSYEVLEDRPPSTTSAESHDDPYGVPLPSRARSNLPTVSKLERDLANAVAVSVLGDFMSTPTARMINELQGTVMRRIEWQAVKEVLRSNLKARTDIGCLARLMEGLVVEE